MRLDAAIAAALSLPAALALLLPERGRSGVIRC
jgi:hypothetical protein